MLYEVITLRYCCPDNDKAMVDERVAYWCKGGIDQYIGGIESYNFV